MGYLPYEQLQDYYVKGNSSDPNSGTPIPILLPYHSHKNPLKCGNGIGSLQAGGPTIGGPWRNIYTPVN